LRAQPDLAPVNIGYGLKVDSQMWLQLQLVIDGITVEKHLRRVAPLLSARSIMSVVVKPNTHAFSLLELVVALAIAATLAVFAIPSYRSHIAKAHRRRRRAGGRSIGCGFCLPTIRTVATHWKRSHWRTARWRRTRAARSYSTRQARSRTEMQRALTPTIAGARVRR
jgi:prepilin-type N-terminal cleavage/methylation domain-containing protein